LLGYEPSHRIGDGLREAMEWYVLGGGFRHVLGLLTP
jgi:hypothetical protein